MQHKNSLKVNDKNSDYDNRVNPLLGYYMMMNTISVKKLKPIHPS